MKNAVHYDPFKKQSNFRSRYLSLVDTLKNSNTISSTIATSLRKDVDTLNWKTDTVTSQPYLRDYIQQQALKQNKKLPPIVYTTIDDAMSREIKNIADQTIYKLLWKSVSEY